MKDAAKESEISRSQWKLMDEGKRKSKEMTDSDKGEKEITIKEVAKKSGLSQATVGRAIGGYGSVSKDTREKVLKAARELNYVPNSIAQSMKSKSTNTVGFVVGNISNSFFSELVHSAEQVATQAGFNLIISNTEENVYKEIEALKMLQSKRVDGLLIATAQRSEVILNDYEKKLYTGTVATVFVDREIFSLGELCVKTDHFGGAFEGTNYLIDKGHTKIGIITGSLTNSMSQRVDGYRRALQSKGVMVDEELIVICDMSSSHDACENMKTLIKKRPDMTAVFALNTILCIGVLQAFHELGVKVPDDISLLGWDDFPLASIMSPALTMITQNTELIGKIAMEKLIEEIRSGTKGRSLLGEKRITLKTEFIERESCKNLNLPGEKK
ncbi:MAG: LacI family DNA-binding transcriptional regulator [Flexilinea sp.]